MLHYLINLTFAICGTRLYNTICLYGTVVHGYVPGGTVVLSIIKNSIVCTIVSITRVVFTERSFMIDYLHLKIFHQRNIEFSLLLE